MSISVRVLGVILLVLLVAIFLLMKMPLSLFLGEQMQKHGITDVDGASMSSGSLWVSQPQVSGLIGVDYQWCPTRGLGSWCVQVTNEQIRFQGVVTPRGNSLRISDAEVDHLSANLFAVLGGFVDATGKGYIDKLLIGSFDCPVHHIEELRAEFTVNQVVALGANLGEHRFELSGTDGEIEVDISGESLRGELNLNGGSYQAFGELLAKSEFEGIVRQLMTHLGGNRYSWAIDGSFPC